MAMVVKRVGDLVADDVAGRAVGERRGGGGVEKGRLQQTRRDGELVATTRAQRRASD